MKNKYKFLGLLGLLPFFASAQLTNNGATIVVEQGATLVVEGAINNMAASTITNSGTIRVEGNFENAGTVTSTATEAKLVFAGATDSDFTPGGGTFRSIEIAKTAGDVTLLGNTGVTEEVDFSGSSNVILGEFDFEFANAATSNGSQATGYFVVDGTGKLVKQPTAAGDFTFDIGDATNYTPLQVVHTGTTYTGTSKIEASVLPINHPDIPDDADDYIERYWTLTNDIAGFSAALTGTYASNDVQGTAGDMVGARFESNEWEFLGAAQSGSTVSGTTSSATSDLTGMNFYGKADLIVNLEGAMSGGSMTENLNLPLTSPYMDAPKTVDAIPTGVTDWIKIETRNASNVVETVTSAFLKSDGTIVGENGTALPLFKDASPSSIFAIYHRNHLPIRTPSAMDAITPVEHDFTSNLSMAYENTSLANDAMTDVGSGVFAMFRANVSGDTNLNVLDFLQAKANTTPSQAGVYSPFDVNLDGNVNVLDFLQAKLSTTPSKVGHL